MASIVFLTNVHSREYVENGIPLYTVYNLEELEVGLSNLHLSSDTLGRLMIYEDGNLFCFNGNSWNGNTTVEVNNPVFVTISESEDGVLYAGGVGSWGRLVIEQDGRYRYEKLMGEGDWGWVSSNRFHLVVPERNGAVFVGETAVVRYDATHGNSSWKWLNYPSDAFQVGDKTMIATQKDGVFYVGDDALIPVDELSDFVGEKAIFHHVYEASGDVLLCTRSAGIFRFNGDRVEAVRTEIDDLLTKSISDMEVIEGKYYALSIKGQGLFFLDQQLRVISSIEKGVDGTFVSANELHYAGGGVLWVSIPDGIAKVQFPNPITLIDERMGPFMDWPKLQSFDGKLYISSTGDFYEGIYDEVGRLLEFNPIKIPGDPIMRSAVMTSQGIVYGENNEIYHYSPVTGETRMLVRDVTANLIKPITKHPGYIIVMGADAHQLLKLEGNEWQAVGAKVESSGYSCVSVEDEQGNIWVEHGVGRFARIILNEDLSGLRVQAFDSENMLPKGWVNIWVYQGTTYFSCQGVITKFDPVSETIQPTELPEWLDPDWVHEVVRPQESAAGDIWMPSGGKFFIIRKDGDSWVRDDITLGLIKENNQELLLEESGRAFIYSRNRVFCYDPNVEVPSFNDPSPRFERIVCPESRKVLYAANYDGEAPDFFQLPYQENDLEFSYFSPGSFANPRIRFSYQLTGLSSGWSEPSRDTRVVFNNLQEGNYRFSVRALDISGNLLGETAAGFRVQPPFYRSIIAWIIYLLLSLAVISILIWWFLRKSEAKRLRLEKLVRARTAELDRANQDLREAVSRAERANSAKGRFLANMSHEIRTPMNGVLAMAEILRQTDLDREQQDIVATIDDSGHLLLSVINDILDYSRFEDMSIQLETIEFDPGMLCERVLNLLYQAARNKGIDLWLDVDPALPLSLLGDPNRIEQILVNLVNNAVKFTEVGEVCLRAKALKGDESKGFQGVEFEIVDDGIGIDLEKQKLLFKPFSQVDPSNTRSFGGSGLGLAICKRLSEEMGGSIELESEVGRGSKFRVKLPLKVIERKPSVPLKDSSGGVRLVLVDPLASRRLSLEQYLTARGFEVSAHPSATTLNANAKVEGEFDWLLFSDQPDSGSLDDVMERFPCEPKVLVFKEPGEPTKSSRINVALNKPLKPISMLEAMSMMNVKIDGSLETTADLHSVNLDQDENTLRILVVEDNVVNQKVAKLMLSKLNSKCDIVNDGLLALSAIKAKPYDLVLMDVQMPGIDGLETTRRIRGFRDISQPVILAMSAGTMREEKEKALASGMDGFLPKPLELNALKQAINSIGMLNG